MGVFYMVESVNDNDILVQVAQLQGYSGCKILLMESNARTFVRKSSKNAEYNPRLMDQMAKLVELSSLGISTPKIFGSGIEDEKFYFDMEYIRNIGLSKYIFGASFFRLEDIIDSLFRCLSLLIDQQSGFVGPELFRRKMDDLKSDQRIVNNRYFSDVLSELEEYDWGKIPFSPCHGDLTLENILVTDSGLVWIDTLDSFANSWLIDLAKVYQDPLIWWSYRNGAIDRSMQTRLGLLLELLNNKKRELGLSEYQNDALRHLIMLNTLRIIPYCQTREHSQFLIDSMKLIADSESI